jgi:hypothetical protein
VTKDKRTRAVISAAGGALALVFLGVVTFEIAQTGTSQPIQLGAFTWIVPVVAGLTVGILGWLLLSGLMGPDTPEPIVSEDLGCPSCGRSVRGSWRLCPYCGAFIECEDPGSHRRYASARR